MVSRMAKPSATPITPAPPSTAPKQGARPDHVERDNQRQYDEDEADCRRDQLGEERVGHHPPPETAEPGDQIAECADSQRHQQRRTGQRQHLHEVGGTVLQAAQRAQVLAQRHVALQIVLHDNHALHAARQLFGLRHIVIGRHHARQRDDALLNRDLGLRHCIERAEDAANALFDARIRTVVLRIVDDLLRRCRFRRIGSIGRHAGQHGEGRCRGEAATPAAGWREGGIMSS